MADRNAHIKISFDSDNTAYISGTSSSDITCTLSPDGYKLTFVFDSYILGGNYSNFGSYDATNSIFTLTKPIEFLTRSATGEIVNRGEVISVSPPSQENSYTYVATIEEISKTTLDLSTLSDITDGTHTVKVKAKASGYNDSEFSNEVSYTKAPVSYAITFGTVTGSSTPEMNGSYYNIKFDDGSYLMLSSSSVVSVEYYDANGSKIGETAYNGENMATRFGVGGVNSTTVEYYGRINSYYDSVDYGYFTVGNSEHLSPTFSSSNPHTTKTISNKKNIKNK